MNAVKRCDSNPNSTKRFKKKEKKRRKKIDRVAPVDNRAPNDKKQCPETVVCITGVS